MLLLKCTTRVTWYFLPCWVPIREPSAPDARTLPLSYGAYMHGQKIGRWILTLRNATLWGFTENKIKQHNTTQHKTTQHNTTQNKTKQPITQSYNLRGVILQTVPTCSQASWKLHMKILDTDEQLLHLLPSDVYTEVKNLIAHAFKSEYNKCRSSQQKRNFSVCRPVVNMKCNKKRPIFRVSERDRKEVTMGCDQIG